MADNRAWKKLPDEQGITLPHNFAPETLRCRDCGITSQAASQDADLSGCTDLGAVAILLDKIKGRVRLMIPCDGGGYRQARLREVALHDDESPKLLVLY